MEKEKILELAKYCLNCKNKPCSTACPMETDIPNFISKIREENFEQAYEIVRKNNLLSHICANICPHEKQCQGKCIRGIKGQPVSIGILESYVNSWARENKIKLPIERKQSKNIKIAVIGSGPAGLSCSMELAKNGYNVTVFEKEKELGGILRYGIPDFRLDRNLIDETIKELKELGVQFETGKELGENLTIEELKKDSYKAIFLGIGAKTAKTYKLSENKYKSIYNSEDFLKRYNTGNPIQNLGKTIVIGGGNVAMDCARVAKESGAEKTTVIYRRDRQSMPARNDEIEDTINENIEIIYFTNVLEANGDNEDIKEVKCIKTKVENNKVVNIPNTEFTVEANSVIFAIGLLPDKKLLQEKLNIQMENELLKVNEKGETNIEGIFAGGDDTQNKATVCLAVACGKKVAKSIMEYCDKNQ